MGGHVGGTVGGREGEVTKIPAVILQLISNLEPMWLNYTETATVPETSFHCGCLFS